MAKKIGIIVLLCFSLCVGGVSAFANEGHDETDTQTLIETQPSVSSVLFRQDGADIQQSTDEGKTWQSYSPIEETDYFTYDEFSAWIENETENIQKLVDTRQVPHCAPQRFYILDVLETVLACISSTQDTWPDSIPVYDKFYRP